MYFLFKWRESIYYQFTKKTFASLKIDAHNRIHDIEYRVQSKSVLVSKIELSDQNFWLICKYMLHYIFSMVIALAYNTSDLKMNNILHAILIKESAFLQVYIGFSLQNCNWLLYKSVYWMSKHWTFIYNVTALFSQR